jgi:hypothetical protein
MKKNVLVYCARSLGGNRNEKRTGSRHIQAGASVSAQNLLDDQEFSQDGDVWSRGSDATGRRCNGLNGAQRLNVLNDLNGYPLSILL